MSANPESAAGEGGKFSKDADQPSLEELNELLPSYEFIEYIDAGGMGVVFKAIQKSLGRTVAVKFLPKSIHDKERFAERFTREARALGMLAHPHIVAVHDSGQTNDGRLYYVMEFVSGSDLNRLLKREALTPRQILTIVSQVCDALQYAHDNGVVHRDIKPSNILIDSRGNVKVADFGLAKVIGPDFAVPLTMTTTTMGTPDYIAPEAMAQDETTDHRADIYSLGVMIYEMLTGHLPKGVWELPSKASGIDSRIDEVVSKALQHDPGKRFQSAADITQLVQSLLAQKMSGLDRPAPRPVARRNPATSSDATTKIAIGGKERDPGVRNFLVALSVVAMLVLVFLVVHNSQQQPAHSTATVAAASIPPASSGMPPKLPPLTIEGKPRIIPVADGVSDPAAAPKPAGPSAEQKALAKWAFEHGGFINVLLAGNTKREMGGESDIASEASLPKSAFAIWRVNFADMPFQDDETFQELVRLCVAAGTVANLNLRAANVTPGALKSLQQIVTLTHVDLAASPAVTESSAAFIAACPRLMLARIGGADAKEPQRISQMIRSLRPGCEVVIE